MSVMGQSLLSLKVLDPNRPIREADMAALAENPKFLSGKDKTKLMPVYLTGRPNLLDVRRLYH